MIFSIKQRNCCVIVKCRTIKWWKLLFAFLFFYLPITLVQAQTDTLYLESDSANYSMDGYFLVMEDQAGDIEFEQLASIEDNFLPLNAIADKPKNDASYWMTLTLKNLVQHRQDWVVSTREVGIAELYFYDEKGTLCKLKTGKMVPLSERNVKYGKPHVCQFRIKLLANQTKRLWLRVKNPTKSTMRLSANIYTFEKWQILQYEGYFTRQLIIGIFVGFLGIMLLYTFTNYLLVRDRIYLYYTMYIAGPFLYLLNYEGYLLPELIGEYPLLYLYFRVLTPSLSIVGYLAFTRAFLKTPQLIPKWDKLFQGLIGVELLLIGYSLIVIPFNLNVFLFQSIPVAIHVIVLFGTFLLSLTLLKDNQNLTRYFVLGAAAYTLSTIALDYIAISRALPLNIGLFIQIIGFVTELVSFSIGLGYRVKLNEEEKRSVEAENARILKEQNMLLEHQVTERTKEIKIQKEEIEMQAEELRLTNERLMDLSEFKQSMTNMIVHDLKNPLSSIIQLTEEAATKQNSLRILNMVMNILDIDKMEETQIPIRWHRHKLSKIVKEAYNQVSLLVEQKNIDFQIDLPNYSLIYADYELIVRVLVNLLTNAVKFTPVNGIISIKAEKLTKTSIKINVTNTGKGIPKAKIKSLFDKYSQLEARKSGGVRASGLGLTFCKLVLEAHDCQIFAESAENGPTTFWFTLPIKQSKTEEKFEDVGETIGSRSEKLSLSMEENDLIQPFLSKLAALEVFDYSEIQEVLSQIEEVNFDGIKQWKKEVQKAIAVCNQEKYQELLVIKQQDL